MHIPGDRFIIEYKLITESIYLNYWMIEYFNGNKPCREINGHGWCEIQM